MNTAKRWRQRRPDPLAVICTGLLVASFALLATIIAAAGLVLDWSGIGTCIAFSIAALLSGLTMKLRGSPSRLADVALAVAVLSGATVCNTLSMNAALRLHLPLNDQALVQLDHLMGFDPAMMVQAFTQTPRITGLLGFAYQHANWLAIVVIVAHGLRPAADWRPFIAYASSLLVATVISVLFPAIGNMAFTDLFHLQGQGLPVGAGIYHLDAFNYYYNGAEPILGNGHISGVGVFPSFHTVMGLVIATGLYGTRFHLAGAAFGGATIVATVPLGGHYVIDIVGGALLWAVAMAFARYACPDRPARRLEPSLTGDAGAGELLPA